SVGSPGAHGGAIRGPAAGAVERGGWRRSHGAAARDAAARDAAAPSAAAPSAAAWHGAARGHVACRGIPRRGGARDRTAALAYRLNLSTRASPLQHWRVGAWAPGTCRCCPGGPYACHAVPSPPLDTA